jgi:hypothetical protein
VKCPQRCTPHPGRFAADPPPPGEGQKRSVLAMPPHPSLAHHKQAKSARRSSSDADLVERSRITIALGTTPRKNRTKRSKRCHRPRSSFRLASGISCMIRKSGSRFSEKIMHHEKRDGRTPTDACSYRSASNGCGSALVQGALACRRSTGGTCCSERTPQLNSSYALPGTWPDVRSFYGKDRTRLKAGRALPVPACPSPAGCPADRSSCRPGVISPEPPGSGGDEPSPAGTAPAPCAGVTGARPLSERDSLECN